MNHKIRSSRMQTWKSQCSCVMQPETESQRTVVRETVTVHGSVVYMQVSVYNVCVYVSVAWMCVLSACECGIWNVHMQVCRYMYVYSWVWCPECVRGVHICMCMQMRCACVWEWCASVVCACLYGPGAFVSPQVLHPRRKRAPSRYPESRAGAGVHTLQPQVCGLL